MGFLVFSPAELVLCLLIVALFDLGYDRHFRVSPRVFFCQPVGVRARYVVLSADSKYMERLPLGAVVWARTGIQPLVCVWSSPGGWSLAELTVLKDLGRLSIQIPGMRVFSFRTPPGVSSVTLAQVGRLFLGGLQIFNEQDVFLISDADMWAVNVTFWQRFSRVPVNTVRDYNFCGPEIPLFHHRGRTHYHIYMFCVAARVGLWRKMMSVFEDFRQCTLDEYPSMIWRVLRREFMYDGSDPGRGSADWFMDERLLSYAMSMILADETLFFQGVKMKPGQDRIDKDKWPDTFGPWLLLKKDAHVHRKEEWRNYPLFRLLGIDEARFGPELTRYLHRMNSTGLRRPDIQGR